MKQSVVFDTSTVVSALVFTRGKLAWLRQHWQTGCTSLVSKQITQELIRVLAYPKFGLSENDRNELLAEYLPFCQVIEAKERCQYICRDKNDQMFLDLAVAGHAECLVSSDKDLLVLAPQVSLFCIETPEAYRVRIDI